MQTKGGMLTPQSLIDKFSLSFTGFNLRKKILDCSLVWTADWPKFRNCNPDITCSVLFWATFLRSRTSDFFLVEIKKARCPQNRFRIWDKSTLKFELSLHFNYTKIREGYTLFHFLLNIEFFLRSNRIEIWKFLYNLNISEIFGEIWDKFYETEWSPKEEAYSQNWTEQSSVKYSKLDKKIRFLIFIYLIFYIGRRSFQASIFCLNFGLEKFETS